MKNGNHRSAGKENSLKNTAHLKAYIEKYQEAFNSLSDSEIELIMLITKGDKKIDFSAKLRISETEFEGLKTSLYQKLSLHTEADYIKCALAFGLISF